jgi:predicted acyltransferase
LLSLDALRGFDLFWIVGGSQLFPALFILTGWAGWENCAGQMVHAKWHGFTAYDLIFPLFIFLSGVALGLAGKPKPTETAEERRKRYVRAFRRLSLLLILGIVYNNAWGRGGPGSFSAIRYASVLGLIGTSWFVAAMLAWHVSWRTQLIVAAGLLLMYWGLVALVPVPGYGAGVLTPEGCLPAWIDQHFLPGSRYLNQPYDPQGWLTILTGAVNAILGLLAGQWLASNRCSPTQKAAWLALSGICLLGLGWLWNPLLPVNKEIWTSSFVLVTSGVSAMLLAAFYGIIDVAGWRWFGWPMAVIGANAILIYLAGALIKWDYTVQSLLGGIIRNLPAEWQPLLQTLGLLAIQWVLLWWLYRRKIFLRV